MVMWYAAVAVRLYVMCFADSFYRGRGRLPRGWYRKSAERHECGMSVTDAGALVDAVAVVTTSVLSGHVRAYIEFRV